ncbi:MAG: hypothetical protein CMF39_05295 [Legionellaceae bacterium]|nr:hypothetical protein [Legionellaceae bacterium]|tara:strand:- start:65 stop:1204 length:1140 start_codon:yes stop_codon:yes gene_type:complete
MRKNTSQWCCYALLPPLYSFGQALSTACDTLYSTRQHFELWERATAVAITGCIEFYESYAFQGQSIIRGMSTDAEESDEIADEKKPCRAGVFQSIYFLCNMLTTFINRYFLLVATQNLYELELSRTYFWSILAVDLFIKQSFAMSNEIYEAYEIIANNAGYKTPFYASMYYPVATKRAREIFTLIGSIEHVLIDDLLGLALLMPKKAIHYLAKHFMAKMIAIAAGITVGLPLTTILLMQVYLFEGKHSRDHLANLIGEQDSFNDNFKLTPCRAGTLKVATNLMAPLHGIASAISVYFALWDDNEIMSATLASAVFCCVALGVYLSEVREGKEALDEMAGFNKENGSAYDNEALLGCNVVNEDDEDGFAVLSYGSINQSA